MLSAAPRVGYIHEPFNDEIRISVNPRPFSGPYHYFCEEEQESYLAAFAGILHFKYPLFSNIRKIRTIMDVADLLRDQNLFIRYRLINARPLIKDPHAFFSAELLYQTFKMNVLVMIRHPAAFCSSLKIKNWTFNFNHFLKQPLLMEKYLFKFEKEIREQADKQTDIIEQAILLWNCIHQTIAVYQSNHPDWVYIRHEDLSLDPITQFSEIYKRFGLEFNDRVHATILGSSGTHNPAEQQRRNEFVRDSRKNIANWKNRLTTAEIDLIRRRTAEVAAPFYAENDW